MDTGKDLLYLSRADAERAGIDPAALADAIEQHLGALAAGTAWSRPKLSIDPEPGRLYQTMIALAGGVAAVKSVGLCHGNAARGLPNIGALVSLFDAATGMPVAVMDGTWLTGERTAALTLVAARRLARPDSETLGFVGAGLQARSHLRALRRAFPIRRVNACSRGRAGLDSFIAHARDAGLDARAASAEAVVTDSDIVVSSVPPAPGLEPFLDARWLAPGAFASLVDIGRSWLPASLARIECLAVDDVSQYRQLGSPPVDPARVSGDLRSLIAGAHSPPPAARRGFLFHGLAIADLAAAVMIHAAALRQGLGVRLAL